MHACTECANLRRQVAELEEVLSGAIFVDTDITLTLTLRLGVTRQQADLLGILHRAGGRYVSTPDLESALPKAEHYGKSKFARRRPALGKRRAAAKDPDFRSPHFVTVLVALIRRRLGRDFIESLQGHGYRLSDTGRLRVAAALATEIRQ